MNVVRILGTNYRSEKINVISFLYQLLACMTHKRELLVSGVMALYEARYGNDAKEKVCLAFVVGDASAVGSG